MLGSTRIHYVHAAGRSCTKPESDCHAAGLRPNGGTPGDKNLDSGRTGVGEKSGLRKSATRAVDGEGQPVQRTPHQRTAGGRRKTAESTENGRDCHAGAGSEEATTELPHSRHY